MGHQVIEEYRHERPARLMCHVLEVPPGGCHARRRRPASASQERREALVTQLKAIHREVKARDGGPRIHAELVARGRPCAAPTPWPG